MRVDAASSRVSGEYCVNGSDRNEKQGNVKDAQGNTRDNTQGQVKNGSIDGSGLNLAQDSISEKKQKAQKEAMDLIMNQFGVDGEIDQNLAERRNTIAQKQEEASEAQSHIKELSQSQEAAKEEFGVEADSEEQKNLDAYMKCSKFTSSKGASEMPSGEEWERVNNMGPLTDYQQRYVDLESAKGKWKDEIKEANKSIAQETGAIRATKLELLKYHGMDDAANSADKVMEAASKEIVGMAMDEIKDNIDDKQEEAVEEAEKKQEEQDEQEAIREQQKAEEQKVQTPIQDLPDLQQMQRDIEQNVNEILEQQKLLQEDLKGIKVDTRM